jgi:hypothetical protein
MARCPNCKRKRKGPGGGDPGCQGQLLMVIKVNALVPLKRIPKGGDTLDKVIHSPVRKKGVKVSFIDLERAHSENRYDIICSECDWRLSNCLHYKSPTEIKKATQRIKRVERRERSEEAKERLSAKREGVKTQDLQAPKRRGRPPKVRTEQQVQEPQAPKRRGRPPKVRTEQQIQEPQVPKRRGRPPKIRPEQQEPQVPKKRGRPRKVIT